MLHHLKNRQPLKLLSVHVHTRRRQTLAKLRMDACVSAARHMSFSAFPILLKS